MNPIRKSIVLKALFLAATAGGAAALIGAPIACSSSGTLGAAPAEPVASSAETTGTVGLKVTLPGGAQLDTVAWTITGPNGSSNIVQSNTADVSKSQSVSFLVAGLPPASGYGVLVTGVSRDGSIQCAGSSTFATAARSTTVVSVSMQCAPASPDAGAALVNASTFACGTINSVMASPASVILGSSLTVSASASGANAGALTYAWAAPTGSFDAPNSPVARYTCAAAGPVTLTLTVGDGPVPDGSACGLATSTSTIQVQCDGHLDAAQKIATATKIKHVVVIFGENVSFDHYFGTYPNAQNASGETAFVAAPGTPIPNGLIAPLDPTSGFAPVSGARLLTNNANFTNAANGAGAANPFRLAPGQAATNDQGHNYKPEQQADDNGAMDLFPQFVGTAGPPPASPPAATTKGLVMAYFDGNTLNSLWSYAQNYALNDNSWTTVFGPSTPGAINLISGQTNGFAATNKSPATMSPNHVVADGNGNYTMIGDTDPLGDVCSTAGDQNLMIGKNVGDLLNAQNVTWGWFEGGFDLTITNANGTTGCARSTPQTVANGAFTSADYIPHHQPFQYYASTANTTHARPTSVTAVGRSVKDDGVTPEPANHQYDSHDFFDALGAGNLPAVSYVKGPAFEDGHAGYSNPIDEQNFVASVVNAVQNSQEWGSTAIVIAYDDSDGWYDHQAPPIVNPSASSADALNGAGLCNRGAQQGTTTPATPLLGAAPVDGGAPVPVQGRCGYGTRMPLLIVSPFAKRNYIDHTLTDQTSILRFVEDNWLGGQRIQPGGSFDTIANPITNMLSL